MGESKKTVQLDWYSEVEQTAKQAGVPLFEHVICRPTTTVRCRDTNGSIKVLGSDFTYTTLQEFVSSVVLPGRPGFQWDEWELKARAAAIAKQYNISAEFHPQEVIEFFEDAKQHLEREPADAQELWHVLTFTNKNRSDARIADLSNKLEQLHEKKKKKNRKLMTLASNWIISHACLGLFLKILLSVSVQQPTWLPCTRGKRKKPERCGLSSMKPSWSSRLTPNK